MKQGHVPKVEGLYLLCYANCIQKRLWGNCSRRRFFFYATPIKKRSGLTFGSHGSNLPWDLLVKNVAVDVMVIPQDLSNPIHELKSGSENV